MVTYIFINHLDHIRKVIANSNDRGISTKKCNGGNAMGITGVGSSYNFVYNTKQVSYLQRMAVKMNLLIFAMEM